MLGKIFLQRFQIVTNDVLGYNTNKVKGRQKLLWATVVMVYSVYFRRLYFLLWELRLSWFKESTEGFRKNTLQSSSLFIFKILFLNVIELDDKYLCWLLQK